MDEAYGLERPEFRAREAAWLTVIACKYGKIHPQGGRRLAASCAAGGRRRRALEALPGVAIIQGGGPGSGDVTVAFDVSSIEPVATLLGARRRRRVSPQTIERLRALSKQHGFRPRAHHKNADSPGQEPRSASRRHPSPTEIDSFVLIPDSKSL
jgi:hypothetical protein